MCAVTVKEGAGVYLDRDVGGRHLGVLGDVGPLHRCVCRHVLGRGESWLDLDSVREHRRSDRALAGPDRSPVASSHLTET